MPVRKRQKERFSSTAPSADDLTRRVREHHQRQWDQFSGPDPFLKSIQVHLARLSVVKLMQQMRSPHGEAADRWDTHIVQQLEEAEKNTDWIFFARAIADVRGSYNTGGASALIQELHIWKEQGYRANLRYQEALESLARIFCLTSRPAGGVAYFVQTVRNQAPHLLQQFARAQGCTFEDFARHYFQALLSQSAR